MSGPTRRPRRAAAFAVLGLAALGLAACAGSPARPDRPAAASSAPALALPLATSAPTADGTWAVVPMGRLDQPINTFWQLLHLPKGGGPWSNQVEATATATNGGLVLAPTGSSLLVGVRPSTRLRFTPLIATTDAGRHWTNGLIDSGLQAGPAALAAAGATRAVALVDRPSGQEVLTARGSLSAWRPLTTATALAASPAGRACGLSRLAAVGYLGSHPAAGGSCRRAGTVGLFVPDGTGWRLAGPTLPAGLRRDRAEVLWLHGTTGGASTALLAAAAGGRTDLLAAWRSPTGGWDLSSPLPLATGAQLTSVAPGPAGAAEVLLATAAGGLRLERAARAAARGGGWTAQPSPPAGTETVAVTPSGGLDALDGAGSRLTVSALLPRQHRWARRQVLHVAIQYGSSS